MKGSLPDKNRREFFRTLLRDLIDRNHERALLSDRIDGAYFEQAFSPLHSNGGSLPEHRGAATGLAKGHAKVSFVLLAGVIRLSALKYFYCFFA